MGKVIGAEQMAKRRKKVLMLHNLQKFNAEMKVGYERIDNMLSDIDVKFRHLFRVPPHYN